MRYLDLLLDMAKTLANYFQVGHEKKFKFAPSFEFLSFHLISLKAKYSTCKVCKT
jgi:hypothetical protein